VDIPDQITLQWVVGAIFALVGGGFMSLLKKLIANTEQRLESVEKKLDNCATKDEMTNAFISFQTSLDTHNTAVLTSLGRLEGRVDQLYATAKDRS